MIYTINLLPYIQALALSPLISIPLISKGLEVKGLPSYLSQRRLFKTATGRSYGHQWEVVYRYHHQEALRELLDRESATITTQERTVVDNDWVAYQAISMGQSAYQAIGMSWAAYLAIGMGWSAYQAIGMSWAAYLAIGMGWSAYQAIGMSWAA